MKQRELGHQAPEFRDVIDSGSFCAPMARWVLLGAAVSKTEFDTAASRRDDWMRKLFESYGLEVGDFDGLARWIGSNGLRMKETETTEEYCYRAVRLLPSWRKPLPHALKPRGRTRRQRR
jgi:hypothetical protein